MTVGAAMQGVQQHDVISNLLDNRINHEEGRFLVKADYGMLALKRIHDVLEIPCAATSPVRPAVLAQATGMSRSTLYLLLESLEKRRWIEKQTDGYLIGLTSFELGNVHFRHDSLLTALWRESAAFVAMHNEIVQLAVLDGTEVVYIAREDAPRPVHLVSDVGLCLPTYCCALGKALLTSLDDEAVCALLPARLAAMTEHTTTRRVDLLDELERIRVWSLATEREEVVAGLACFAAFVGITPLGKRVAVSSNVPVSRLDARREKRLVVSVVGMADHVGRALAQA